MPSPLPLSTVSGNRRTATNSAAFGRQLHRRAAPYRRGAEDHAVGFGSRHALGSGDDPAHRPGRREDRDRAAHAFAEQVDRPAGIGAAQHADRGDRVDRQTPLAGPGAAAGRAAEAALVVGIGGDAVRRPGFCRHVEGVAVVVEAVQRQDHRLDRSPRQPFAQRQRAPSEAMNSRSVKRGAADSAPDASPAAAATAVCRLGRRAARRRQQQQRRERAGGRRDAAMKISATAGDRDAIIACPRRGLSSIVARVNLASNSPGPSPSVVGPVVVVRLLCVRPAAINRNARSIGAAAAGATRASRRHLPLAISPWTRR